MSYFAHSDERPEWAAQLPEDWECDWLKWSVDLCTNRPTVEEQEALPYIANEHIASWTGRLLIEEPKPAEADSRTFQQNDVLFNKLRPYLAKVHHAEFHGVSSGELLCLRPTHVIESRFLFYLLLSKGFIDTVNAETFGAKMPRADWEIVGHQPLPLPPLVTQRRIAQFLDEKTAKIDGLIEKKRALLDLLAEKRQALITRAVTKGIEPDAAMKPSGIEWIGDIPAHWEIRRVKELGELIGGTGFPHDFQGQCGLELPFFKVADLGRISQNQKMLGTENSVDRTTAKFLGASIILPDDVAFAKVGAALLLNRFRRIGAPCCIDNNMMAFRSDPRISPDFTLYTLSRINFSDIVNPGAVPSVNSNQVGQIEIALPRLNEQIRIAQFLDEKTAEIDGLHELVVHSVDKLAEYRSALITAAVTGQLAELQ